MNVIKPNRIIYWSIIIGLFATSLFAEDGFDNLFNSKRYKEALAYADDKIPANARDGALWCKIAAANEALSLSEKALACFSVASRIDPKSYDAFLGMARIYNKMDQPENGIIYAKKALDLNFSGDASWEYARACIKLGKQAEAKKALEKVIESTPGNTVASRELGIIYYNEKNYDKALGLLKSAYTAQPDPLLAIQIGKTYRTQNRADSAIFYFKAAQSNKQCPPEATVELARLLFTQQSFDAAAREFEKADNAKTALDATDIWNWSQALEQSGADAGRLLKSYQQSIQKFGGAKSKDALTARLKAARILIDKKNSDEALTHLTFIYKADTTGKSTPGLFVLLAEAADMSGNSAKAIAYLEKEIAANRTNIEAYARLADLYTKAGKNEKTKSIYEKMIGINPNNPAIQLTLGDYNLKAGKIEDALAYYQKSYTLERSAKAAEGMAITAFKLKKTDMARDAAESALRLDETLLPPRVVLSTIFMQDKNYRGAIEQLEVLTQKDAANSAYWQMAATAYEQTQNTVKLAKADRTIISLDKNNTASRLRLALYQQKSGDLKAAADLYRELLPLLPTEPSISKSLYEISQKNSQKADAITYGKIYIGLKPADAAVWRGLADLYYDNADSAAALNAYQKTFGLDPAVKGIFKRFGDLTLARSDSSQQRTVLTAAIAAGEGSLTIYARLASIYYNQKAYAKAIDLFQKALQLDPQNASMLTALATCQAKSGQSADAVISYEQVIAMNPAANIEFKLLGDLYLQQNKKQQAVNVYKKFVDKNPAEQDLALMVADFSFSQKNYEDAAKYYALITGVAATKNDYLFNYGQAAYQTKNLQKADELFRKLAQETPDNPAVFKTLYDIAVKSNRSDDAIKYLKQFVALKPQNAEAQKNLGNVLLENHDTLGALNAYRNALKADSTITGIYKKLAPAIIKQGNPAEIIRIVTFAAKALEADNTMFEAMGNAYAKLARYPAAIAVYQKVALADPRNLKVLSSLAFCQFKNNAINDAIITYEQLVAMNTTDADDYKTLAELYLLQKKTAQAMGIYKKYLEKKSTDQTVALKLGEYYYAAKSYDDAYRYLAMVQGEPSKSASYLNMLGQSCYQSKSCTGSAEIFRQLLAIDAQNTNALRILFDLAMKAGNKSEAISYLKRYTLLRTSDAQALSDLGGLLYEQKDMDGSLAAYRSAQKAGGVAKGFYKRYIELIKSQGASSPAELTTALSSAVAANEADAAMYIALGTIYQKQALYPKAIALFLKAQADDPRNPAIVSALALCQAKTGAISDAILSYEQAIAMNTPDINDYLELAALYLQQKKSAQAMGIYKKYLVKKPGDPEICRTVGTYEFNNKNYDEALKYLSFIQGPQSREPALLTMLGTACEQAKNCNRSAEIYTELLAQNPQNAEALRVLYLDAQKNQNKADAAAYLKRYAALKPGNAALQKELGDLLYDQKNTAGSLAAYRNAIKANPSIKGVYKKYIELISTTGGTAAELSAALNGAISTGEADAGMYAMLGDINLRQSFTAKAIALYQKSLQLDPRNIAVLTSLARCQAQSGSIAEAVITYEQVVAMNGAAVAEYKELGALYQKQKKNDQAMGAYQKYIEKNPKDFDIAQMIGMAAFAKKDYAGAIKYLDLAAPGAGNDPEYAFVFGQSNMQLKDYKKAIPALERIRSAGSKTAHYSQALNLLGLAYEQTGEPVKAAVAYAAYIKLPGVRDTEAAYKRAALIESTNPAKALESYQDNTLQYPRDYRNFIGAGLLLAKTTGTQKQALGMLRKAAALADTSPQLWLQLGRVYGKLDMSKEELEAFQKYIQVGGADGDALGQIGEIFINNNKPNDAMVFLEMANSIKPNDPRIMFNLGKGYVITGRLAESVDLLEKARNARPDVLEIRVMLFDVYQKTDNKRKAYDEAKFLVAKKRDNMYLLKMAQIQADLGNYPDVENIVADIRATNPENLEALMVLGKVQRAQKKLEEALETYKEVSYINTNYVPALIARAEVYLEQSKPQWAKTFFERAIQANPKAASAELGLALTYKMINNNKEYQNHLQKAQALEPKNKAVLEEIKKSK